MWKAGVIGVRLQKIRGLSRRPSLTNLAAGVVTVVGADDGVGPDAVEAAAETSYVVPGGRPVMLQSYGTAHVTDIGEPPPTGVAVTVYGPLLPAGGEYVALILVGPVAWAMIGECPMDIVVNIFFGDGIVAAPVDVDLPIANTS